MGARYFHFEEAYISLGRDKSIVISRAKNENFSKRRTVGASKVDSRSFEIVVKNNKSQAVELAIFDQIPKPVINDISVEATERSGGVMDPATGRVKWELLLSPQERADLVMRYEVKYPKKERIILE
ncbi:MAG: DUF4139 domain-containing protein [Bacteroidota bacterium]